MNTVLPARDRPVTPIRNPRPREKISATFAALLRASLRKSVRADKAGLRRIRAEPLPNI